MKLDREIVFSYLEEDNTQRAYFRLVPLLTVSGDAREEAARLWPDHGALRIVPDKNEQGYFKDRMRVLGHFCIMDLTPFPPEANKIRTNKNYRPDREEKNQYILYSDTVKAVPDHTFFEVLDGAAADFAALAEKAVTTAFMIREGDTLFGPVNKTTPALPSPAPEMTAMVYDVACPDGVTRTILCSEPVKAAAPAEEPAPEEPKPDEQPVEKPVEKQPEPKQPEPAPKPAEDAPLPIGKPLEILDKSKDFTETLQSLNQPLSQSANLLTQPEPEAEEKTPPPALTGTPLVRSAGVRTSQPRPKNKVQEVVANQLRVAKNDPPAEPLPHGAKLHAVENPVESACRQFTHAWNMPEARQQLVDFVLSLPGMSAHLTPSAGGETPLQKAMQAHLNDLEAERLSALVQLDKAQGDLESFRINAVSAARADAQKKLRALEEKIDRCSKQMDEIRNETNALAAQRNALQAEVSQLQQEALPRAIVEAMTRAQMLRPVQGAPVYLNAAVGEDAPVEALVQRLTQACAASGVALPRNEAVAVLTLLAVCRRFGVASNTPAAARTLLENVMGAMGWRSGYAHQMSDDQRPVPVNVCDDGTPLVYLSSGTYHAYDGVTSVYLTRSASVQTHRAAYDSDPWPILPLRSLPFVPHIDESRDGAPVTLTAFTADEGAFDARALETLQPILSLLPPLSGKAALEMKRFITLCARVMDGGLQSACDWAIALWLLPCVDGNHQVIAALRPLLAEYPVSASRL